MKNKSIPTVLILAFSMAAITFSACEPKTESRTTIIERRSEPSSNVTLSISGKKHGTHLHIKGK